MVSTMFYEVYDTDSPVGDVWSLNILFRALKSATLLQTPANLISCEMDTPSEALRGKRHHLETDNLLFWAK